MKKKFTTKIRDIWNWRYWLMILISLLSIIPISFMITNVDSQLALTNDPNVTQKDIADITYMPVTHWKIMLPLIIGIIVWTSNAVLSIYFIHTKKIEQKFGLMSAILGGVSLHLFVYIYMIIFRVYKQKNKTFFKNRNILISIVGVPCVLFAIIPIGISLVVPNHNTPVVGNKVKLSLDKSTPNLIEVFTDGFDRNLQTSAIKADSGFKDFVLYNHYMALSTNTRETIPSTYGSFHEYNNFTQRVKHNWSLKSYISNTISHNYLESFLKHIEMNGDYFDQKSVVNTISLGNSTNYAANQAGNGRLIKQKAPDLNVTNWTGARDAIAGSWGFSNKTPAANTYQWLNENMIVSDTNKASRVFIQDEITHPPYLGDADNTLNFQNNNLDDQLLVVRKTLLNLFESLKSIKNSNTNGYDNSMIIIYGDHSDHRYEPLEPGIKGKVRKAESLLLIKYPQIIKPKINISNRLVWSPQINSIISNLAKHPDAEDTEDFIEKGDQFDPKLTRPITLGNAFVRANYDLTLDKLVPDESTYVEFQEQDKAKLKELADKMFRELY